jgi:hypothetical protein
MSATQLQKLKEESKSIPEPCPHISKIQHLLDEIDDPQTNIIWNELEYIREISEQLIISNASLYEFAKEQNNELEKVRALKAHQRQ